MHAALGLGARVIAAVRRSQLDEARRLGAHEVLVLGVDSTPEGGFDHIADTVGGPEVAQLCRQLGADGRIRTVATTPIDPTGLPTKPELVIVHADGPRLERLAQAAAASEVEFPIAHRLPLVRAAEAHRLVEVGGLSGKVVLLP